MFLLTGLEQYERAGTVLRLTGGDLSILVTDLDSSRRLVVTEGQVKEMLQSDIRQPATCEQCQQPRWWWGGDFEPRCVFCDPPDSMWKMETMETAKAFIARAERVYGKVKGLDAVLDRCLNRGDARAWCALQKLAFFQLVPALLCGWWQEQQAR